MHVYQVIIVKLKIAPIVATVVGGLDDWRLCVSVSEFCLHNS